MNRTSNPTFILVLLALFTLGTTAHAEKASKRPQLQKQTEPTRSLQKAKTPKLERIGTANFAIKSIAVAPVGSGGVIQQGKHVRLDIRVENTSNVDGLGTEKVQLKCTKINGSGCPVADSLKTLPKIKAGSSYSIIVVSAQGANPGKYKVSASPVAGRRGSGRTVTLNVGGKLKPSGATATSPAARPGLAGGAGLNAMRVPPKLTRHPKWKIFNLGEPQWKHASCTTDGPPEFPHFVFKNEDSVVFPAGSSIIYLLKSDLVEFRLVAALSPGATVKGPQISGSMVPVKCVAVAKI